MPAGSELNKLRKSIMVAIILCSISISIFILVLPYLELFQVYHDTDYGYSIAVPITWEKEYSPISFHNPTDESSVSVIFGSAEFLGISGFNDAIAWERGVIHRMFSDQILSEDDLIVNGMSCHEFIFITTATDHEVKIRENIFLKNGYFFNIMFSSIPSSYENNLPTFDRILQSFKVN
jgi:hypothetical protein